jgi:hypothetical protein
VFDAIEMFDHAARGRLRLYASSTTGEPLTGFWTVDEIERDRPQ